MSLKMIKPITITDEIVTSTIPEPDASQGEAVWIDPNIINQFGTLTSSYSRSALASNGYVYAINSDNNNIAKIDTTNQTITYFGTVSGLYFTMQTIGDYIYCIGSASTGNVLKIGTNDDSTATFGTISEDYDGFAVSNTGDLYCVSSDSTAVLKVNTRLDTASTFGSLAGPYQSLSKASNGMIYGMSGDNGGGAAIKINPNDDTITTLGEHPNLITTMQTGSNGSVYGAGSSTTIVKIDSSDDSISFITSATGPYAISESYGDYVLFISYAGKVASIATSTDSITNFGDYQSGFLYSKAGVDAQGRVIVTGTADGIDDSIMVINANSSEVLNIESGYADLNSVFTDSNGKVFTISSDSIVYLNDLYNSGDQVISTATHKVYQCVSDDTLDEPVTGSELTVPSWVEVYATNKYRAFDYVISTKSTNNATVDAFDFFPGEICTSISFFGMERVTNVYVRVREDDENGTLIYNQVQSTAITSPADDQASNDEFLSEKVIFDDLPVYENPYITVSFNKLDGTGLFSIGDIVLGNARSLGLTTYSSSTSRTSYDTVEYDTFGNVTTVSRPSAEYTSFEVVVYPEFANYVERILKDSLNQPRVWVSEKLNGEKLFTFGYYERSPITYTSPTQYNTNLKIRGLV